MAGTVVIDWLEITPASATGTIGDIRVRAETTPNAPFVQAIENGFSRPNWNADFELAPEVAALVTKSANAGEVQTFQFDPPIVDPLFYIENLDSHTEALLTVENAVIELISRSPSVVVKQRDDFSKAVVSSSNQSFDGEGDLILRLVGEVSSVRMAYYRGIGDNGVLYGFAIQNAPESFAVHYLPFLLIQVLRRICRGNRPGTDTTRKK